MVRVGLGSSFAILLAGCVGSCVFRQSCTSRPERRALSPGILSTGGSQPVNERRVWFRKGEPLCLLCNDAQQS